MTYALIGLAGVLAVANALTIRWSLTTLENAQAFSAQERDALTALHAQQLSEFANRIQVPERAANLSVSEQAPDPEPYVAPDYEYEREALNAERP